MSGPLRWFDQHCHLPVGADSDPVVAAAAAAGVDRLLTVGTDVERSRQAIAVAERHPAVWATAGVHPHDASDGTSGLAELLEHPAVVAVGEAGLDYHYDHSPRAEQRHVFAAQVGLAHQHDLPLVIHTREAWDDTFAVLDSEGIPRRTVFHCFTGGPAEVEPALARGAMVSISGIVTFKTADDLRDAVALVPLDRLLVETDSPYLTPEPHRGRPNQPALVAVVGQAVASVLDLPVRDVAQATTATACSFYAVE
ncbi:MAG: TatD family hydrolase [Acidimicrobiia bacterium]|nr:TatD family hydrolase [Acidimicrobiia bacterium]